MNEIKLKIGELQITTKHGLMLVIEGLSSCIGLAVYDKRAKMAGMAHIVLPSSSISNEKDINEEFGKYADTAVPGILERMLSLGSKKEDLIIKIAGGTSMLSLENEDNPLNIGERNIIAVKKAINSLGLHITKADVGGYKKRTLKLNVINGAFYIKTIGQEEIEF
ncbi:MAG TPA: chemotaxis protein CheD [Candidatus Gastranaerophilales bacterium]|nr:chemotaxis protein CheD [Candidatus Gastranaerophilales bacterium]